MSSINFTLQNKEVYAWWNDLSKWFKICHISDYQKLRYFPQLNTLDSVNIDHECSDKCGPGYQYKGEIDMGPKQVQLFQDFLVMIVPIKYRNCADN